MLPIAKHRLALFGGGALRELRLMIPASCDEAVVAIHSGLYAKAMIMDHRCVFYRKTWTLVAFYYGAWRISLDSPELNAKVRQLLTWDMQAQNAWG